MGGIDLARFPVHLGVGGTALREPEFTRNPQWFAEYGERHAGDGKEGRLVSLYTFSESWPSWEMHPAGSELVLCIAGRLVLHQEHADGSAETATLGPGEYAINPPGTWHTADVSGETTALFVTAGYGTEVRKR